MQNTNALQKVVEAEADNSAVGDQTLANIRELLYGETRRELVDRIAYLRDRQREFEDWTRCEMRRINDEMRAESRRQDEARRSALVELSASVQEMAEKIAKLAEK